MTGHAHRILDVAFQWGVGLYMYVQKSCARDWPHVAKQDVDEYWDPENDVKTAIELEAPAASPIAENNLDVEYPAGIFRGKLKMCHGRNDCRQGFAHHVLRALKHPVLGADFCQKSAP